MSIMHKITAIVEREDNGYTSLCPEFDIASQGDTIESARKNLQEAMELFLECADPSEISRRLKGEVYITEMEIAIG